MPCDDVEAFVVLIVDVNRRSLRSRLDVPLGQQGVPSSIGTT
jgi:hypothetical protein